MAVRVAPCGHPLRDMTTQRTNTFSTENGGGEEDPHDVLLANL
jgi:hypothetical protein